MEAICSSKILVDFQQTTQRYILEDSTLHNHWCEKLKSYNSTEKNKLRETSLKLNIPTKVHQTNNQYF
jgi:hypothetical protein